MKELTVLLEQLALKLGTTVEHLWGVLLRQAPISGTVNIIISVTVIIISVFFVRLAIVKTKGPDAEWDEEGAFLIWVVALIIAFGSSAIVFASIKNIASAFLNPEYWALNELLTAIKQGY